VNNDINRKLQQEITVKYKEYLDFVSDNVVKHVIEVLDNRLKVDRYAILGYRKKLLGTSFTYFLTHLFTHLLVLR
jgi:hypothetical protein